MNVKENSKSISPYRLQVGQCYRFQHEGAYPPNRDSLAGSYHFVEQSLTFKYEGKKGIHHFFREIVGGWIRTFTNAQFIGTTILETEA